MATVGAWATAGACAQIGKNAHLSGGVGGALEPMRAGPTPPKNGVNLYCAVIVTREDTQTRSRPSITELLRD